MTVLTSFGFRHEARPKVVPAPCPDWLGREWLTVARRRLDPVTGYEYWAWHLDAVDREALIRARDGGNAATVNCKEDGKLVLKAIRLR